MGGPHAPKFSDRTAETIGLDGEAALLQAMRRKINRSRPLSAAHALASDLKYSRNNPHPNDKAAAGA
jgi:hypothetical protein